MSNQPASRRFLPSPTLQDVLDRVRSDPKLTATRRRDLASALRTLARVLDAQLGDVPADPRGLRKRLERLSAPAAGLSPTRWANVRSLVTKALIHAGIVALPGRRLTPLSPAWQNLYDALPTRALQSALTRFIGYCSVAGVEPDEVDGAVADRYLALLQDESIVKNPRRVHQTACRCWNTARARVQAWPRQTLTVPRYQDIYGLPWPAFPASLREEVDRWLAVLSGDDLFATDGPAKPLRPSTIKTRREQVRWFASALVHCGRDPASLNSLVTLADVSTVKTGLRFLLDRHGGKPTRHLHNIAYGLRSMARWAGASADALAEITGICGRLNPRQRGLTEKNKATLRQFDHPDNVDALVFLPDALVKRAQRRNGRPSKYAALDVQIAVAIGILLVAPVRIHNLASIRLGRNLVRVKHDGLMHLVFPQDEVKNSTDLEYSLPAETVDVIELYCRNYRPQLIGEPSEWLFPGQHGKHKAPQTLAVQICARANRLAGLRLTPHQFRHVTGKLFLDENPGEYEVVKQVLGHQSQETAAQFYVGLANAAAIRHFDTQILGLRKKGDRVAQHARTRGRRPTGKRRGEECRRK